MTTTRFIAAAALALAAALAQGAARAQQAGIGRTEVQRHDLPIPGREAVQVRVDFDPGAGFPRHRHPGEEIAYVLEGTVEYRLEGQAPVTLKAGDSLFIPAGTVHAARNVGNGNASELATYIIEKGKPPVELLD
jgi:quercetin dioxygenase-like cupin family protein